MAEDWVQYFGLKLDPFSTSPISTSAEEGLFFKTTDVRQEVDPWVDAAAAGQGKASLLLGGRGFGKTTTLRYMERSLRDLGAVPVFIRMEADPDLPPKPSILSQQLIQKALEQLTYELESEHPGIAKKLQAVVDEVLQRLGLERVEGEYFPIGEKAVSISWGSETLSKLSRILTNHNSPIILLIDNLDKYLLSKNRSLIMDFLEGPKAQSFFESITESGGSICISSSPRMVEMIDAQRGAESQVSFLTDRMILDSLPPKESADLLHHRFAQYGSASSWPFKNDALLEVAEKGDGVPRLLVFECKRAMIAAAGSRIQTITASNITHLLKREDFPQLHNELWRDSLEYRRGCTGLLSAFGQLDGDRSDLLREALVRLFGRLAIDEPVSTIAEEYRDILQAAEFIDSGSGTLDSEVVRQLFSVLQSSRIDSQNWTRWFLQSNIEIEVYGATGSVTSQKIGRLISVIDGTDELSQFVLVREGGQSQSSGGKARVYSLQKLRKVQMWWQKADVRLSEADEVESFRLMETQLYQFIRAFLNLHSSILGIELNFRERHPYKILKSRLEETTGTGRHVIDGLPKRIEQISQLRRQMSYDENVSLNRKQLFDLKNDIEETISRLSDYLIFLARDRSPPRESFGTSGRESVQEYLRRLIHLSTGRIALLAEGGKPISSGSILLWKEAGGWFCLFTGKGELYHKMMDICQAVQGEDLATSVRMGEIALDSSVLISGDLKRYARPGLLEYADVRLSPAVSADRKHTTTERVAETLQARLKLGRDAPEKVIGCEGTLNEPPIPDQWEEALAKIHWSNRKDEIDRLVSDWAGERHIKLAIGDRDIAKYMDEFQPVLLAIPNTPSQLSRFDSLGEFFEKLRSNGADDFVFEVWEVDGPPFAQGVLDIQSWRIDGKQAG